MTHIAIRRGVRRAARTILTATVACPAGYATLLAAGAGLALGELTSPAAGAVTAPILADLQAIITAVLP